MAVDHLVLVALLQIDNATGMVASKMFDAIGLGNARIHRSPVCDENTGRLELVKSLAAIQTDVAFRWRFSTLESFIQQDVSSISRSSRTTVETKQLKVHEVTMFTPFSQRRRVRFHDSVQSQSLRQSAASLVEQW